MAAAAVAGSGLGMYGRCYKVCCVVWREGAVRGAIRALRCYATGGSVVRYSSSTALWSDVVRCHSKQQCGAIWHSSSSSATLWHSSSSSGARCHLSIHLSIVVRRGAALTCRAMFAVGVCSVGKACLFNSVGQSCSSTDNSSVRPDCLLQS